MVVFKLVNDFSKSSQSLALLISETSLLESLISVIEVLSNLDFIHLAFKISKGF